MDQSSLSVLCEARSQWEAVGWECSSGGGLDGLESGQDEEKEEEEEAVDNSLT